MIRSRRSSRPVPGRKGRFLRGLLLAGTAAGAVRDLLDPVSGVEPVRAFGPRECPACGRRARLSLYETGEFTKLAGRVWKERDLRYFAVCPLCGAAFRLPQSVGDLAKRRPLFVPETHQLHLLLPAARKPSAPDEPQPSLPKGDFL